MTEFENLDIQRVKTDFQIDWRMKICAQDFPEHMDWDGNAHR